ELLQALPNREEIMEATAEGDLSALSQLLPMPSHADIPSLFKELRELQELFGSELSLEQRAAFFSIFLTYAQGEGIGQETESPKDAFRDSVELAQHLREIARDADATLPSLEQRLTYLQGRKATLAGIIRLPEEEVGNTLDRVEAGSRSASTKSLLNLMGIFRYLRSTANFVELEQAMNGALFRMRSSVGRIRALFVGRGTPQAEAAELLRGEWEEEKVEALQSGENFETQKEVVRAFLERERATLEEGLLSTLSPEKKKEIVEKMVALEAHALANAENPTELREALEEIRALLLEAQTLARAHRPFPLRLFDALRDFLS
ncbi:MAG: hypothetical protein AAB853_04535, partial [Patescibacteria group bacterium]